jgi:glyceraldehyde 3-phosphate dehydrogenase
LLSQDVTRDEVIEAYRKAAGGPLGKVPPVLRRPARLDRHRPLAVQLHLRQRADDGERRMAKVFGWYDNEWGYSCRLVDLIAMVGATLPAEVAA